MICEGVGCGEGGNGGSGDDGGNEGDEGRSLRLGSLSPRFWASGDGGVGAVAASREVEGDVPQMKGIHLRYFLS